jgi:hypothetical protein
MLQKFLPSRQETVPTTPQQPLQISLAVNMTFTARQTLVTALALEVS